jgi:hypothetical protein
MLFRETVTSMNSLKPTHNSSSDYFQLISDDHNYLQPIQATCPKLVDCDAHVKTQEVACMLMLVNQKHICSMLNLDYTTIVNPSTKDRCVPMISIRSHNIVYAEQAEYDQIVDEYDEIVDVAMVDFQPLDNTRSRSQQHNNVVCDDQHTESSFESTSREQPRHVQDVVLPADETP